MKESKGKEGEGTKIKEVEDQETLKGNKGEVRAGGTKIKQSAFTFVTSLRKRRLWQASPKARIVVEDIDDADNI